MSHQCSLKGKMTCPLLGTNFPWVSCPSAHLLSKMLVHFIKDSFQGCLYSKQPVMRFHYILTRMDKIENIEKTMVWI